MVYCNECARKRGWPMSAFKVGCYCEVCMEEGACNEYPSSMLMPRVSAKRPIRAIIKKEEKKVDGVKFSRSISR